MKRILLILLCILLLCGCVVSPDPTTVSTAPAATSLPTQPETDPLTELRENLNGDFSFSISCQYMHLANNGFSQEITQEHSLDGGFHFISSTRIWDHSQEYENTDQAEYYYQYENGTMVCYVCTNGAAPQRMTLTKSQVRELAASRAMLVGPEGLLPDYLEDFSQAFDTTFTFRLPLDRVMQEQTLLSSFISNAFALYGAEFDPDSHIFIGVTVEVDLETLAPLSFTYDFTELKPYVLSEGDLSAEYALETDLMYMQFTLDYVLAETIQIPDTFIP